MEAQDLIREFKKYNIGPYIEVPCSLLAPIISELSKDKACELINPANEAIAMGMAAGSYLAKQRIPMLLMQNSGLCNTLNSLTSLHQMYRIPLICLISWRGQPRTKDAPEHYLMGKKLIKILKTLDVPYFILTQNNFKQEIAWAIKTTEKTRIPVALILRKGFLTAKKIVPVPRKSLSAVKRDTAIDIIISASYGSGYFISTNGFISRDLFHVLKKRGIENINPPFYMLGSMGHALPIALGLERHVQGNKKIILLDGDGGCLMHLGAMASVDRNKTKRLIHVILDNGTYASTGGQPTLSRNIDFLKIARGCGYRNTYNFSDRHKLKKAFPLLMKRKGPAFVHILISSSESEERPRVSDAYSCEKIKKRFMKIITGAVR